MTDAGGSSDPGRLLLVASTPDAGQPSPPAPPPPFAPPDGLSSSQSPSVMIIAALLLAVALLALLVCKLFRRRSSEGPQQGLGSLCCECAMLCAAREGHVGETTAHHLSTRSSQSGGPNLPTPRVQVNGGTSMAAAHDQLEIALESDIEARLRRWQVRALESHPVRQSDHPAERDIGMSELDCTPRTRATLAEVMRTETANRTQWNYEEALQEAMRRESGQHMYDDPLRS